MLIIKDFKHFLILETYSFEIWLYIYAGIFVFNSIEKFNSRKKLKKTYK